MKGGEIYVKKIPSMTILDIAKAVVPSASHKIIGIRPGEKIHEQMIGLEDAPHTYEFNYYFKILPAIHNWSKNPERIKGGKPVASDFSYSSDTNKQWMKIEELQQWLSDNKKKSS
jgi:FlaA1/EpsC-like NDP-sugar epimerase